jgi:predicted nucleotidyltransferase
MSQDPLEILPEMEVGEPSLFAIILEKIIMVIGGAVSLVLIWFALKILFRLIKEAFKWLLEFLKSYVMYQENVGFIDEKEKLIGLADIGRDYRDRFQNWLKSILEREPKWEELQNNHQRIRFLYRHLILRCLSRGYTYKKYLTPKETALDILDWDGDISPEIRDLTHAYDETRYGQTAIEDSKVHQLAKTFLEKQRRF